MIFGLVQKVEGEGGAPAGDLIWEGGALVVWGVVEKS